LKAGRQAKSQEASILVIQETRNQEARMLGSQEAKIRKPRKREVR
jgi:hypothetical protein